MELEKKPLVSVIVLTYNHVNYIKQCLDSILNQETTFNFEIILGDDGSSDGTTEICREYAAKFPQIKLQVQDRKNVIFINGAATGRFNFMKCFEACIGKYIAWCEGDDYWVNSDKLQNQVNIMETDATCSGSYHDTILINFEGVKFGMFREDLPEVMYLEDTIDTKSPFHTSSFIARRDSLNLPHFMWRIMSSDMAVFSLAASHGKLVKADNVCSAYRKHNQGMTTNTNLTSKYHELRIDMLNELWRFFKGRCDLKFEQTILKHQNAIERAESFQKPSLIIRVLNRIKRIYK